MCGDPSHEDEVPDPARKGCGDGGKNRPRDGMANQDNVALWWMSRCLPPPMVRRGARSNRPRSPALPQRPGKMSRPEMLIERRLGFFPDRCQCDRAMDKDDGHVAHQG